MPDFHDLVRRLWYSPVMADYPMDPALVNKIAYTMATRLVPEFIMEECDGGDCGRHGADCEACEHNQLRRKKLKELGYVPN